MKSKILPLFIAFFALSALFTPVFVLADHNVTHTIQQLQEQIAALQSKINAFKAGTPASAEKSTLPASPITVAAACPNITRSLYLGLRDGGMGGQVSELQRFLAKDPSVYPEGLVTGYFGPLTEKAVQRWQAKQGIVSSGSPATTGYGVVGPRTRVKIAAACQGAPAAFIPPRATDVKPTLTSPEITVLKPSVSPRIISVSPASGAAGIKVTISGEGFTNTNNTVKFGVAYIQGLSAASDGAAISFMLPYNLDLCEPNKLVCASQQIPLTSGEYMIKVINANGVSNSFPFSVK